MSVWDRGRALAKSAIPQVRSNAYDELQRKRCPIRGRSTGVGGAQLCAIAKKPRTLTQFGIERVRPYSDPFRRGFEPRKRVGDSSVSRAHAKIETRDGDFVLVDLKSTNGTLLNDRLVSEQPLRDGDRFKVGPAIFKFFAGDDVEAQYHEQIYNLMVTDALTQASTLRFFVETAKREMARARRHGRPFALVMFDIDRFKQINDTHSHLAGDYVLRKLGKTLRAQIC